MPWWVWLILALFMLGMLIAGCVYAAVHGMRALHDVSKTGAQISERLGRMGEHDSTVQALQRPIFTEPLRVAAERYSDAHVEVIERRQRREERHVRTWSRWSTFND